MLQKTILIGLGSLLGLLLIVQAPAAGDRLDNDPPPFAPQFTGEVSDRPAKPSPSFLTPEGEKMIVFTANQGFLSRIYILRMDGSVYKYHEYFAYRWVDLEVVGNELYAADAIAPRVYKVDPKTGGLEVIIDDWSLYYFYGLGFDGTYFYVDEWSLNRYNKNGKFAGSTSFDYPVYGSAWDGSYFWTLGDDDLVRCWDFSRWPGIQELASNHFPPPSAECRGLWYDGTYFWTAESKEDELGKIYQFDHQGQVINEWWAPAYTGWGAAVITLQP